MAWNNSVNAKQTGVQTINAGSWTGSVLTQHNLLVGGTSSAITSVAPSATAGVAFVSAGSSADPAPGTVVVAGGGTGLTSLTAHNLIVGNGTSNATLLAPSSTSGIPLISGGSSADPSYGTAVVAGGGTGLATLTPYAVLAGGTTSTGNIQQVSGVGTSGQFLTSNGASALPTWQSNPSVLTVAGDSGTATGNTITFNAQTNAGKTVKFTSSGSTVSLSVSDANGNTYIGSGSGNTTTSGTFNTCLGFGSGPLFTSCANNNALGANSLAHCTSGDNNMAIGSAALTTLTTGTQNLAIGTGALELITTGGQNVALGYLAGISYTGAETGNICIGASVGGTVGESNKIRIGTQGTATGCFVGGISGVTVTGAAVLVSTSGQLGVAVSSIKFKKKIKDMGENSCALLKLRPVTFEYKQDKNKRKQYGLIAEEVYKILPNLVVLDDDGNPHSVMYHEIPSMLLNEVIKMKKQIEILEKKL